MSVGVVERDRRLLWALPLTVAAAQVVAGGVDLLLASALEGVPGARGVTTFGAITSAASFIALVCYPLAGIVSDRTPARLGRRSLWVAVGSAASVVGLVWLGQARTAEGLAAGYVAAFALLPLVIVPLYAAIPDRIEPSRRGASGSLIGASTIVGGIAGNLLAARFSGDIALGTVVFAAILAVGAVAFVLVGDERGSAGGPDWHADDERGSSRSGSDLAWFAAGRFAMFLAYAAVTSLAYFVWRDHLGQAAPANGVAAFAVVSGLATLLAALVAGPWSDRTAARRPFVVGSAAILALGLLLPAVSATVVAWLASAALIGLGFGVYLSVGTALGTLVLPSAQTSGRDLGLIGASNASAQAIAPVLGAFVASTLGYPVVFVAAAGLCAVTVLTTLRIRSVR